MSRLVKSMDINNTEGRVELIVVDDGSTDDTPELASSWQSEYGDAVKYEWQKNAGRGSALLRALCLASGRYSMIMDSDDYFVEGWLQRVLDGIKEIERLPRVSGRALSGLCYTAMTHDCENTRPLNKSQFNFKGRSNFLAIRADHGVAGDLKEVVRTDVMKRSLYSVPPGCRRVPTSLIWARVATTDDILYIPEPIIIKSYLPGGMTEQVLRLKVRYPEPLLTLYSLISDSRDYRSLYYRWRSRLLWARFAHHAHSYTLDRLWKVLLHPIGLIASGIDRWRLRRITNWVS